MRRFFVASIRFRLLFLVLLALLPALGLILYKGLEQRHLAAAEAKVEAMRLVGLASSGQKDLIEGANQLLVGLSGPIASKLGDRPECDVLLASLLRQHHQYSNLGVATLGGEVICSALPLPSSEEGVNISDRPYFRHTLQTHDFSIGSYQIDRIARTFTINFGYPVFGEAGELRAVVFAALDLSVVIRAAAQAQLPEKAVLTVRDSSGTILFRYPEHQAWFGRSVPEASIVKTILSQQGWGTAEAAGVDGVERLYAFAPLSNLLEPSVYLSIGIDRRTAFSRANREAIFNLAWLGLVALLAFAAAWFGGSLFIMNQVKALIAVTRKLKEGVLDARCGPPYDASEFGQLAQAFDEMSESLNEYTRQLERAEEKYRTLVEQVPAITYMMQLSDPPQILYISPQVESFGFPVSEWMGDRWSSQLHPDDRDRVCATFLLSREGVFNSEYRLIAADGRVVWVRDESRVLQADIRKPRVVQGIIRDITERRALSAQLIQTQKMEALGTLAGGIAHDFNNILGAILASTEMAKEDFPEASGAQRQLDRVLKASFRARDLVKQILAFSRQAEQQRIPIEVEVIVKEALKLLRATLPATIAIRQEISISPAASPGLVMADPTQIHQIIMNLCTNAAHAMRETGGEMAVFLEDVTLGLAEAAPLRGVAPGAYLRLTVRDTGRGMDKGTMERIFDPFFTTKAPGEGTGMGLSVVHGIVTSYGGAVTVDSAPGKGAAFHVLLPAIEPVKLDRRTQGESAGGPLPVSRQKGRILFVDDEEELTTMWEAILKSLGYEVTATTSSVEALEIFRRQPERFDLVVSDQTMPHLVGLDLAGELVKMRPDIRIILCTGNNEAISDDRLKSSGIHRLITKPFGRRELAAIIRDVLDMVEPPLPGGQPHGKYPHH